MQRTRTYLLFVVTVLIAPWQSHYHPALAAESVAGPGQAGLSLQDDPGTVQPVFVYQLEGRPDPFTPFISGQSASQLTASDEIIDEELNLTGMRQFEPGQLTLVAVMFSGEARMAMVEDVTGRGYMINEGMAIGRRGTVTRIDGEQVTIIETARTRAGRELTNKIVMRLKKEGEN